MGALVVVLLLATLVVCTALFLRRRTSRASNAMASADPPARLLAWAVRRLPAQRAQWGQAMLGDLQQLEHRPQRWRFAVDCVAATILLPPPPLAKSAGFTVAVVAAGAACCVGLMSYAVVRYPGVLAGHGAWRALTVFLVVLAGYTLAALVVIRRGVAARSGLAGGLGMGTVWVVAGATAVSHPSQPAYSLLLLAIPLASLAVGAAATWRGRTGTAGRQVALLSAVIAGLVLFVVLASVTLLTANGPYDAGLVRDFPASGAPDLPTYAVSDSLGSAMVLLLLAPMLTATVGCAGASITAWMRRAAPRAWHGVERRH